MQWCAASRRCVTRSGRLVNTGFLTSVPCSDVFKRAVQRAGRENVRMATFVRCVEGCEGSERGDGLAATLCVRCDGSLCVLCRRVSVEEVGLDAPTAVMDLQTANLRGGGPPQQREC